MKPLVLGSGLRELSRGAPVRMTLYHPHAAIPKDVFPKWVNEELHFADSRIVGTHFFIRPNAPRRREDLCHLVQSRRLNDSSFRVTGTGGSIRQLIPLQPTSSAAILVLLAMAK
jgi:hypothetical protein